MHKHSLSLVPPYQIKVAPPYVKVITSSSCPSSVVVFSLAVATAVASVALATSAPLRVKLLLCVHHLSGRIAVRVYQQLPLLVSLHICLDSFSDHALACNNCIRVRVRVRVRVIGLGL